MPDPIRLTSEALSSALKPAGPDAAMISEIGWIMTAVFGGIFAIVMLLLLFGIRAARKREVPQPPLGDHDFILVGGAIIPGVILAGFLVYALIGTAKVRSSESSPTIRVTGNMWWWDVQYPDSGIRIANEIYIPVNTRVRVELGSSDVIHSLWVPSLSGKTDLLPGIGTVHWLEASRPGTFRGFCAEYCGTQHAWMQLYVVALPEPEFRAWVRSRSDAKLATADQPTSEILHRGREIFHRVGCAECHAIHGVSSPRSAGPDLTHIGSRLSLGAAKLPNGYGNLAGWISNPQAIKPGNKMPATYMEPDELHALVSYLLSLK